MSEQIRWGIILSNNDSAAMRFIVFVDGRIKLQITKMIIVVKGLFVQALIDDWMSMHVTTGADSAAILNRTTSVLTVI